jgi:hypothetical protein
VFPENVYQEFLRLMGDYGAQHVLPSLFAGLNDELNKQRKTNKVDANKICQIVQNLSFSPFYDKYKTALVYLRDNYKAQVPSTPRPVIVGSSSSVSNNNSSSVRTTSVTNNNNSNLTPPRVPLPTITTPNNSNVPPRLSSVPPRLPSTTVSNNNNASSSIQQLQQRLSHIRFAPPPNLPSSSTPSIIVTHQPLVPSQQIHTPTAASLIELHRDVLEQFKSWTCADAINFRKYIAKKSLDLVLEREQQYHERLKYSVHQGVTGVSAAIVGPEGYTWTQIAETAKNCMKLKAAVCFSFALTAVYILMGKSKDYVGPRIEIVASDAHVFVIVGRVGGFVGSSESGTRQRLPPANQWNSHAIVVDAWAGSLGNEVIYDPASTFWNGMTQLTLTSYFDSDNRS